MKILKAMKTSTNKTKRVSLLIAVGLMAVIMPSCIKTEFFPCLRPEGERIEEVREVSHPFQSLELRLHGNVFVREGRKPEVLVEAPENFLEHIVTGFSDGNLIIRADRCLRTKRDDINIFVVMPALDRIRIAGSGYILLEDTFAMVQGEIDIAGSGKVTGKIKANKLKTSISGSGEVELSGYGTSQDIYISGPGEVRALELKCREADIRINGSGNVYVQVKDKITARISGSGNIYYLGNPEVSYDVNGMGKLIYLDKTK